MQSLRDIKKRIHSVKNIAQITKAMEVVSMNKMRRSQQFAIAARPYALASLDILENVLMRTQDKYIPELLKKREVKHALLVVVTADKGLVGGFNDAVLRKSIQWVVNKQKQSIPVKIVAVGKKARDFFERQRIKLEKSFIGFGDYTSYSSTHPIAQFVLKGFIDEKWDSVDAIFTQFKTTLKQETLERKLLPADENSLELMIGEILPEYGRFSELRAQEQKTPYKYNYSYTMEPSAEYILRSMVSNLLKIVFHHVMLESNASEHSARMVTMKSASDNATELKGRLTLEMNKARQAGITAEISEIIAGAEALT